MKQEAIRKFKGKKLYKIIYNSANTPRWGSSSFVYNLPIKNKPGKWMYCGVDHIMMCYAGMHFTFGAAGIKYWTGSDEYPCENYGKDGWRVYECEVKGDIQVHDSNYKGVALKMRLTRELKLWEVKRLIERGGR